MRRFLLIVFLLAVATGARMSAILDLTWDRVDFDRRLIDLNPAGRKQTAKRRPVVTMNAELHEALQKAYAARQCAYVVERGAKRVASVKKAFSAASERSGVSVTPYTLRHTGAVWAAEAGISMAALIMMEKMMSAGSRGISREKIDPSVGVFPA